MKLLKRNKDMIHFSGRRHTKLGICSALIGIIVVLTFLTISVISGTLHGNGGFLLGVIGICLFPLAVFGFVLSYKAFKQKDIFYRFPMVGALLNGCMTVFLLIIYILGFGG
ncbi:MAG: putative rane protein [Herbinix sp.]|jgi:O-antigen/teichoic acid export membrane protein|nr:putative rane protein [Herbinix sp.]